MQRMRDNRVNIMIEVKYYAHFENESPSEIKKPKSNLLIDKCVYIIFYKEKKILTHYPISSRDFEELISWNPKLKNYEAIHAPMFLDVPVVDTWEEYIIEKI